MVSVVLKNISTKKQKGRFHAGNGLSVTQKKVTYQFSRACHTCSHCTAAPSSPKKSTTYDLPS